MRCAGTWSRIGRWTTALAIVGTVRCGAESDDGCRTTSDCPNGLICESGTCRTPEASTDAGERDAGSVDGGIDSARSPEEQAVAVGSVDGFDGDGLSIMPTLAIDLSGTSVPAATTPLPTGFDPADFHGAVDPAATVAWWQNWTYVNAAVDGNLPGPDRHPLLGPVESGQIQPAATGRCRAINPDFTDAAPVRIFGVDFPVCLVRAPIVTDTVLSNDHVYVLSGAIRVGTGNVELQGGVPTSTASLQVKAGTQLYGVENSASSLIVTRGSRIDAAGTGDAPIVMGAIRWDEAASRIADDPTDLSGRGAWGGIRIAGFGLSNAANQNGERLSSVRSPSGGGWFGGNNNEDASGSLRFIIIAEAGFAGPGADRAPALNLEGVGRGSRIDYVQVLGSEADCLAAYGGAARVTHLVCLGAGDDAIDFDEGFEGQVQFALVRFGRTHGERGLESDSSPQDRDATPTTRAALANITILGNAGGAATESVGATHRRGARDRVYRSVYTDDLRVGGTFENGCFDLDVFQEELLYRDVVFNCSPGPLAQDL